MIDPPTMGQPSDQPQIQDWDLSIRKENSDLATKAEGQKESLSLGKLSFKLLNWTQMLLVAPVYWTSFFLVMCSLFAPVGVEPTA